MKSTCGNADAPVFIEFGALMCYQAICFAVALCAFIRNRSLVERGLLPQVPRKEGVCCLLRFGTSARASRSCRRIFLLQSFWFCKPRNDPDRRSAGAQRRPTNIR